MVVTEAGFGTEARGIAADGGCDGAIVLGRLLDGNDANSGFNAQSGEYGDMIEAGIVDSTKVMCSASRTAAGTAGRLITTEVPITERPERRPPMGAAPMPAEMGL
jgi:chaperonin GroEL